MAQESLSYPQIEIILLTLVAVAVLATVAQKIEVPYSVLLVLGGLILGLMLGLPRVGFDPGLVFLPVPRGDL
jgi:CPA1 family monovalent cation:H+ antiporter